MNVISERLASKGTLEQDVQRPSERRIEGMSREVSMVAQSKGFPPLGGRMIRVGSSRGWHKRQARLMKHCRRALQLTADVIAQSIMHQ
jgi:hypothetical protein